MGEHLGIVPDRMKEIMDAATDILANHDEEYDTSPVDNRALFIEKIRDFKGDLDDKLLLAMAVGATDEYMRREGNTFVKLISFLGQEMKR